MKVERSKTAPSGPYLWQHLVASGRRSGRSRQGARANKRVHTLSHNEHLFMGLLRRLERLATERRPIRVAVVGVGQMGSGLARQVSSLPGMRLVGLCDVVLERAMAAATETGILAEVAESGEDARAIAAEGRLAVTTRAEWLAIAPDIDVLLDATGDPDAGARLALTAVTCSKPVVSMNVEADVTVGPLLAWLARRAGALYTVAGGDEPSVLCEMVEFARATGLEVVCAGKGKNNRLDRTATPQTVEAEAAARGMSPRMLAAFVDGTKTMIEMAALANATGLEPDCPGMHGPLANLVDLLHTFVPATAGGLLQRCGVVDYAIGDVAPGVFVIATTSRAPIRRDLAYLKMGEGPYYLLHRPYHLASLEAPLSVARAVLDHEVTMAAAGPPGAECVAVAKRDLRVGERIDGIGGETVYGLAVSAAWAAQTRALPIGVVSGARVRRDVARGAVVCETDAALEETATVVHLRRLQDVLVHQGILSQA